MWFFFSIAAIAMPVIGLWLSGKGRIRLWPFSLASFLFYVLVCMDELFTIRRRCFSGDFGGIEDTIGAVLLITGAVAVVLLILNAVLLAACCEKE